MDYKICAFHLNGGLRANETNERCDILNLNMHQLAVYYLVFNFICFFTKCMLARKHKLVWIVSGRLYEKFYSL